MNRGTSIRLAALLLAGFIQACGSSAVTPPPVNSLFSADVPLVQATTPANLKKGVAYNTSLSATFSEAMDPATVNTGTFSVMDKSGSPVAGTVSYSGRTAVFKPAAPLAPDTMYSATVTTAMHCKDTGNPLSTDYNWMFFTSAAPDTTAPQVTLTAFAVAQTNGVYGGLVVAFFSEPMDPATISPATFLVTDSTGAPVPGTTLYIGLNAVFYPILPFAPNATYTATITTGAEDLAGNGLTADRTWTFTTPNESTLLGTVSSVTSTSPSNLAVDVARGSEINASFSQVMDPFSITPDTFKVLDPDGLPVSGTLSYTGTIATFTPAFPLIPNNTYEVVISSSVKSLAGVTMDADYSWVFTTGADLIGTPPIVQFTTPLPGDTNVPLNTSIIAAFDEPMDPATINVTSFTLTLPDGTPVPGMVSYAGMTAVFVPDTQLLPGVSYAARITTAVTDAGGTHMVGDYTWTFSTGADVDAVAPQVLFTNPANDAVRVALNTKIDIAFSDVMDPTTVTTGNIVVTGSDGSVVTGTIDYLAYVAIFTPSAPLAPGVTYTVTVGAGVKDLEALSLATPYSFSFTTLYAM